MKKKPSKRSLRYFQLLEVLLALSLVSLVLVPLVFVQSRMGRASCAQEKSWLKAQAASAAFSEAAAIIYKHIEAGQLPLKALERRKEDAFSLELPDGQVAKIWQIRPYPAAETDAPERLLGIEIGEEAHSYSLALEVADREETPL